MGGILLCGCLVLNWMLLKRGTGNGERGTGNEEQGTGNGGRRAGSGERGTSTPKLSVLLL